MKHKETSQPAQRELAAPAVRQLIGGRVRYDATRRRVWVYGQRVHHGLTGVALAGLGVAGLAARRLSPVGGIEWTLLGSALMVHDWKDRAAWFELGPQDD